MYKFFFFDNEKIHLLTIIIIRLIILSSDIRPNITVSLSKWILFPVFCKIQMDRIDQILETSGQWKNKWVIDSGSCEQIEQYLSSEIFSLFRYTFVPIHFSVNNSKGKPYQSSVLSCTHDNFIIIFFPNLMWLVAKWTILLMFHFDHYRVLCLCIIFVNTESSFMTKSLIIFFSLICLGISLISIRFGTKLKKS